MGTTPSPLTSRSAFQVSTSIEGRHLSGPLTMTAAGRMGQEPPVYIHTGFERVDWLRAQHRDAEVHEMMDRVL